LNFLNENNWQDADNFSLDVTDILYRLLTDAKSNTGSLLRELREVKTSFFVANNLSKKEFTSLLNSEIGQRLKAIVARSPDAHLRLSDIFPKMDSIQDEKARSSLRMIEGDEKFLRGSLVGILREQGAGPIPSRDRDTAQEVADIELFQIKIGGRSLRLAVVIKGFKSISGKTLKWKDVIHQVTRAYQRGKPHHIILASAKEPADGLITSLEEYASSVDVPHLVLFIPPLDLTKILLAYNCLNVD